MDPYLVLIIVCLIVIVSFFFNLFANKTNIPSVLLLIALGVGLQQISEKFGLNIDFFKPLEYLGILGLIVIVLEAALDLELKKEKWPIIWKSFVVAFLSLILTTITISYVIRLTVPSIEFIQSIVYAIPLSVMSSAIIIPSVSNLTENKKEFLIYEATFSDIFGIMLFYMIIENLNPSSAGQLGLAITGNIFITIAISLILSYLLLFIIQRLKGEIKFFLFLSVLVLLYSVGKSLHLSSLIIILMFGLLLRNHNVLLFGALDKFLNDDNIDHLYHQFRMIIIETSFIVRTLFFVVFGMTLPLAALTKWDVWLVSIIFLIVTYVLRFILLRTIQDKKPYPQTFITPRGLITVLLFFAIPQELKSEGFESGLLFVVIIATNIIMALGLISSGKKESELKEAEEKELEAEGDTHNIIEEYTE